MKAPQRSVTRILIRFTRLLLALSVAICAVLPVGNAFAASRLQEESGQTLLVHFAEGTTPEARDTLIAEMGGVLVTWMHQINVAEIRLPAAEGVRVASLASSANGIVTHAEEDWVVEGADFYNDPNLADESMSYGLEQVQAVDAWEVITGSQEIIIAIVDSGIKLDHPEFAGRLVAGYDFVNDDNDPDDDLGHGTHVAGIAAAALGNSQGVAGVCPNCRLMPVKVLNENNVGSWSHLAQGILFAVDHGAQIINLSLGASVPSETLQDAIQYALDRDVIVVAAAGNLASDQPFYPAALDGVIGVGASTNFDSRWSRSNYGRYIDLVAPGTLIFSTYHDLNNVYHGYTFMSGTSMAAPFVSGVAGLLLSANRELTPQQVTDAMIAGAEDLGKADWDVDFGYGRVRALEALKLPKVGLADRFEELENKAASEQQETAMIYLPALGNN